MSGYLKGPQKAPQPSPKCPKSAERSPPLAPVLCFGSSFRYYSIACAAAELPLCPRHNVVLILGALHCYRSENVLQSLMAFDGISDGVTLVESFEPGLMTLVGHLPWAVSFGHALRQS